MKLSELGAFVKRLNAGINTLVTANDLDPELKEVAFKVVLESTLKRSPLVETE